MSPLWIALVVLIVVLGMVHSSEVVPRLALLGLGILLLLLGTAKGYYEEGYEDGQDSIVIACLDIPSGEALNITVEGVGIHCWPAQRHDSNPGPDPDW